MDFLMNTTGIWIYFVIFFGKILEVTISTLRLVLINRGERVKGSLLAFFDVLTWLMITGSVLSDFGESVPKIVVFCLAFAVGNYLGSWLDNKLAFGISSINVILSDGPDVDVLLEALRGNSFAVTAIDGQGKDGARKLLIIHLKRKRIPQAVKIIHAISKDSVISVNDVKSIRGGYLKK